MGRLRESDSMSVLKKLYKWWEKTLAAIFEWLKKRWKRFLIGVWAFLNRPLRSIWIALKWIWNTIIGAIWWLILPLWRLLKSVLQWIGDRTLIQVVRFALWSVVAIAVLIGGGLLLAVHYPASQVPDFGPAAPVVYQDQGWPGGLEAVDRQTYYYTPQGTGNVFKHMRYSWFVNLEQPWGETRVANPEHMLAYGFQVDAQASTNNPDRLPVGFTKIYDKELGEELLDVTCAACHTGNLLVRSKSDGSTVSLRIDGGQGMHAFTAVNLPHFAPVMIAAMTSTLLNPWKWDRFARKVLKDELNEKGSDALREEFKKTYYGLLSMGINESRYHLSPTQEGYARTDALARIANQVFGDHITKSNYHIGNAPVNYPPVWDIWKFDWVQYSASVAQPMARNLGESLGVGATYDFFDRYNRPVPQEERYDTTSNMIGLHKIELALRNLRPPLWDEKILGEIDKSKKAVQGGIAFIKTCQGCHGPRPASFRQKKLEMPLKTPDQPHWEMKTLSVEDIGTDPNAAVNFVRNTYDLTSTGLTDEEVREVVGIELELKYKRMLNFDFGKDFGATCPAPTPAAKSKPGECAKWGEKREKYFAENPNYSDKEFQATCPALTDIHEPGECAELREKREENFAKIAAELGEDFSANCLCAKWREKRKEYDAEIVVNKDLINLKETTSGQGLNYVGLLMREIKYAELKNVLKEKFTDEMRAEYDGFGALDVPRVLKVYKARPLGGIWATAPFLHNGSVPTLYQLLSPRTERDSEFFMGRPEFDTENVGIKNNGKKTGGIWLVTSKIGNANTGHEFRDGYSQWNEDMDPQYGVIGNAYSHDERMQIIEYLKVHLDDPPHSGLYGEVFANLMAEIAKGMPTPFNEKQIDTDWPHGGACNLREYVGNHKSAQDLDAETLTHIELIEGRLKVYFNLPGKDTCGGKTHKQKGANTDA